jgi:WD40 repeat protein
MRAVRHPLFTITRCGPYSVLAIDVTDLVWSPEDWYLASVGLDSQVLIWSGYTLGEPVVS